MYTHFQVPMPMTNAAAVIDCTTTGDKARFSFPLFPAIIRAVALESNATPGDVGVVKLDKRPTFSSDTNRGDGDVAVLNILASATHGAGKVIYKRGLNVKVSPGEEVVVEVTDASASLNAAKVTVVWEPLWEEPANIAAMIAST